LALSNGTTASGTGNSNFSVSVTPTAQTTYTLASLTDANCPATTANLTGTTTVRVNARPTVAITSPNTAICVGASTNITGNVTAIGAWTLTLNNSTTMKVTGTGNKSFSYTVTPTTTPITYVPTALTDANCAATTANLSGTTKVTLNPRPTATLTSPNATVCKNVAATLTGTVTATGAWTLTLSNGTKKTGVGTGTYTVAVTPTANTTYTIASLTNTTCAALPTGLTGTTVLTTINCPSFPTVIDSAVQRPISIYPNPFTSVLTIETDAANTYDAVLTDISGKILQRIHLEAATTLLPTDNLATGIYLIHLYQGETRITTQKVMKE
jgi:hypothetical protein